MENDFDDSVIFNDIPVQSSIFDDMVVDQGSEENSGSSEEEQVQVENLSFESYSPSSDTSSDYTLLLEDLITNQETIISQNESISLQLHDISDNCFRLYYFIGGLYVAFAIVLAIKFFKMFF